MYVSNSFHISSHDFSDSLHKVCIRNPGRIQGNVLEQWRKEIIFHSNMLVNAFNFWQGIITMGGGEN